MAISFTEGTPLGLINDTRRLARNRSHRRTQFTHTLEAVPAYILPSLWMLRRPPGLQWLCFLDWFLGLGGLCGLVFDILTRPEDAGAIQNIVAAGFTDLTPQGAVIRGSFGLVHGLQTGLGDIGDATVVAGLGNIMPVGGNNGAV